MNNSARFEKLLEKYKENALNELEFQELLRMLDDTDSSEVLESVLIDDWLETRRGRPGRSVGVQPARLPRRNKKLWLSTIAASFLILVSTFVFFILNLSGGENFTTYTTAYSEIKEIELSDGSSVTLNANSTLTWNNRWQNSGVREAELTGEAFFDIEQLGDGTRFHVRSGDILVEVIGTSFNMDSRDRKVEVYLDEGEINLLMEGGLTGKIRMEPGQRIQYDLEEKKVESTTNESMITAASWKRGVLNFKDKEFRWVLERLKNIYGKSFYCDDQNLLSKTIYLGVPYSDWDAVRQALELSLDIRFADSDDRIKITSNQE